ncbi:hypothetical protein [Nonomuraea cavernae]|uniref:hypothetical protein n=1 Tax=Nonomuraea cavernae TaxID=2045107 RepID=UPI0033F2A102
MTRTITALADRLAALVAPKAEASAACTPRCDPYDIFCYCSGAHMYAKAGCITADCKYYVTKCKYVGLGC